MGEPNLSLAVAMAAGAHRGQHRDNDVSTPYILHPCQVMAYTYQYVSRDEVDLCVAVLHGVIEDNPERYSRKSVENFLGPDVAFGVDALTRYPDQARDSYCEQLSQLRVGLRGVKLCDNLSNGNSVIEASWSIERKKTYAAKLQKYREVLGPGHDPRLELALDLMFEDLAENLSAF